MTSGVVSEFRVLVDQFWHRGVGTPPANPKRSEFINSVDGTLCWSKINVWKKMYGKEVALWLDRLFSTLLEKPLQRRRKLLATWLNEVCDSKQLPLETFYRRLEKVKVQYADADWVSIFPDGDPIAIMDSWDKEAPNDEKYRQVCKWIKCLQGRVLFYPQRVKPSEVNLSITAVFGRPIRPEISDNLSNIFASSKSIVFHNVCLVNYVFFRAVGTAFHYNRSPICELHLGLQESSNTNALLALISEGEGQRAVSLMMALDDADWNNLTRSFGSSDWVSCIREIIGLEFADRGVLIEFLYRVVKYRSEDPRIFLRKVELIHNILNTLTESKIPNYPLSLRCSVLHVLTKFLKNSEISAEELAILCWYRNLYGSFRERSALRGDFNEIVNARRDLNCSKFLQRTLEIFRFTHIPPVEQIDVLRNLLENIPPERVLRNLKFTSENEVAFIFAIVYAPMWNDLQEIDPRFFDAWFKAAFFTAPKELLRGYLDLLNSREWYYFATCWFYIDDIDEGGEEAFNMPYLLREISFQQSLFAPDQIAIYTSFVQQIPALVIYAATKSRSHTGREIYLGWLRKVLPLFTEPQVCAFFAALSDGTSPQLTSVVENVFERFNGFTTSHTPGMTADNFITLLEAMSSRQQEAVFSGFKQFWTKELIRVQEGFLELCYQIAHSFEDELAALELKFMALQGGCRVLSSFSHSPLLRMYHSLEPSEYVKLTTQFEVILSSETVSVLEEYFAAIEEEEVGISSYLVCFTQPILQELSGIAGSELQHLSRYGIYDDDDLKCIVGEFRLVLQLAESHAHFMSCVEFNSARASELLAQNQGMIPPHIQEKVLEPLGDLIKGGTPEEVLLQFIACWEEGNFLAKLRRYLLQSEDFADIWSSLPWKKVSEIPGEVDLFHLKHM